LRNNDHLVIGRFIIDGSMSDNVLRRMRVKVRRFALGNYLRHRNRKSPSLAGDGDPIKRKKKAKKESGKARKANPPPAGSRILSSPASRCCHRPATESDTRACSSSFRYLSPRTIDSDDKQKNTRKIV